MNNWESKLAGFRATINRRINDIHINCAEQIRDGVAFGSTTTGAPGQMVDTETLRQSYLTGAKHIAPLLWRMTTNLKYAEVVEEGGYVLSSSRSGAMTGLNWTQRSEVGGPHSIALTRANFQRVADRAVREIVHD